MGVGPVNLTTLRFPALVDAKRPPDLRTRDI